MKRNAALALLLCFAAAEANGRCLVFCPENGELFPAEATEVFARDLGKALPSGVEMLGMIDGGFQDRFIQVKLGADSPGARVMLAALGADPARSLPPGTAQTTIAEADWWDIDARPDLALFEARLGRFPHVTVGRARDPTDPSRWLIYIFAFET